MSRLAHPSLSCSFARLRSLRHLIFLTCCAAALAILSQSAFAQTSAATLSGTIIDTSGALMPNVRVTIVNEDTGVSFDARTNKAGIYNEPGLNPGRYRVLVEKEGFKQVDLRDLTLNVQDVVSRNFTLEVGGASETIQVDGSGASINTTDASVSTVIDRQFAENLPLNGRSFQSLLYLTPGVTLNMGNSAGSGGQFTVNGQRGSSNYWMVDGVSANIGVSPYLLPGNGTAGGLGAFNILGGTNSLVSVDALQEFRVQTSTYSPEFGRTPGGQISIVTRSGTNQFHGTVFDYFRNTVLDAADWFANHNGLPKAAEQQNDFGGTLGGPVIRDKTFFFFSYEGLRLRLPQTLLTTVPDLAARQSAVPATQAFLNAFPLPNQGATDIPGLPGVAPFNASFSAPAEMDAYGIRIDHQLAKSLNIFGRYNHSPSKLVERSDGGSLNTVWPVSSNTSTLTLGATWAESPHVVNEARFNYSSADAKSSAYLDTFGGGSAAPASSIFPSPFTYQNAELIFQFLVGTDMTLTAGDNSRTTQRQYNLVDTLSVQRGTHSLKVGVDYRRLSPHYDPGIYYIIPYFSSITDAEAGNTDYTLTGNDAVVTFLFHNLGAFAQDTWRVTPRLTMTYGVRWDIDFTPSTKNGPSIAALSGFSFTNLSALALAPAGTPIYNTQYGNVAPRVGLDYQLSRNADWGSVLRGGFGTFYDLASTEVGNQNIFYYPYESYATFNGAPFPPSSTVAALPPIVPPNATQGTLFGFDPHLSLPYTLQWSVALEQALGMNQTFTGSYIGSSGRRLLLSEDVTAPNQSYAAANLVANAGTSDYNALQLQFRRRLSNGLQALASYTWAHSIDTGSYGSYANGSFANINANRGSSDSDTRHAFSTALTYNVPTLRINAFAKAILGEWSTENIFQALTAPPVDVIDGAFANLSKQNASILIRPDVVAGQPLYLYGPAYAGGKALNPNAFVDPPTVIDPTTGLPTPTRQGDLARNALRAFGLTQWDFAVHRGFPIYENVNLQFRAEMFNVLNHPNFGLYDTHFGVGDPYFGQSTQMLGQSLSGGLPGNGGLNGLYQLGGPRSIQLALKLSF